MHNDEFWGLAKEGQCCCLNPRRGECFLKILFGHHRFTMNSLFINPSDEELHQERERIVLDEEKLLKIKQHIEDTAHLGFGMPLRQYHYWEFQSKPTKTIHVILSNAGQDYNLLSQVRSLFDKFFHLEVFGGDMGYSALEYIFEQVADACFGRADFFSVPLSGVVSWAIKALKALDISAKGQDGLICNFCIQLNLNDDPRIIGAFEEIGADPISVQEGKQSMLHELAKFKRRRTLREAMRLFKEKNISVDWKFGTLTAYSIKIIDTETKNDQNTREMLEEMLEAGADPLLPILKAATCLHYVISHGLHVSNFRRY